MPRGNRAFQNEQAFEDALVDELTSKHHWSPKVLNQPSEDDLLDNWADIVFRSNMESLNGFPLTKSEKDKLLSGLVNGCSTPANGQRWLQGRQVTITRDNPDDAAHFGKHVSLTVFFPTAVAGAPNVYQIARQPVFYKRNKLARSRRGDLVLLVNGLPLIHVELKNSGHSYSEAANQLMRYASEGLFGGLFRSLQVFVAMTPDEMRYFANPGHPDNFKPEFYFSWRDRENKPVEHWKSVAAQFLSIPAAHELVANYMIADQGDQTLKVLRSYQIHAIRAILHRLSIAKDLPAEDWTRRMQLGGYIWHTTGSGKTMTSYKAAELIARDRLADKVVFVLDRIDLSNQSFDEYTAFLSDSLGIEQPRSASQLLAKLRDKKGEPLVVTSLHKLEQFCSPDTKFSSAALLDLQYSRFVFVVDEAHRSTFGNMFANLKRRFPHSVVIGFTGTPIEEENSRDGVTTSTLFGDELHRYTVREAIQDGAVLKIMREEGLTVSPEEVREMVALEQSKSATREEAYADPEKLEIYSFYMDSASVPYASKSKDEESIEDLAERVWRGSQHRIEVAKYISKYRSRFATPENYHAILATNSVKEAIEYYQLLRDQNDFTVTAIFSDSNENTDDAVERDAAIQQILADYNKTFKTVFSQETHADFVNDVALRLAHKKHYRGLKPELQIDLVIVVEMLLTGYDSKYVNTLYLDKVLTYEHLIQACSRTNRVLDRLTKPSGNVVYFRKPYTMRNNFDDAYGLYSGSQDSGVFVDKLPDALRNVNRLFQAIRDIFEADGIENFEKLPSSEKALKEFVKLFNELAPKVQTAFIQGFDWDQKVYEGDTGTVTVDMTLSDFESLKRRYIDLQESRNNPDGRPLTVDEPLDLDFQAQRGEQVSIDTDYIDELLAKRHGGGSNRDSRLAQDKFLEMFRRERAKLPEEDQHLADMIIDDIESGVLKLEDGKTFSEYLADYRLAEKARHIRRFSEVSAVEEALLETLVQRSDGSRESIEGGSDLSRALDGLDIDVFGRWMYEERNIEVPRWKLRIAGERFIRDFVLAGPFDPDSADVSQLISGAKQR